MIAGVAVDRSYKLVGGQIQRAKRLVRHVARQELNVWGFLNVRPRVQVFASPDWTYQRLVGFGLNEAAQLIDDLPEYRLILRSRFDDTVLVTTAKVNEYLPVVPF